MWKLRKDNKKNGKRSFRKRSVLMYGLIALVMVTTSFAALQADHGGPGDSSAAGGTWTGDGSYSYPYQISDAAGLKELANEVNNGNNTFDQTYFILTDDIYLNVSPYNAGAGWVPIGNDGNAFNGNFDGCGHSIAGLFIDNSGNNNMALFGTVGGTVKNLGIENVSIAGSLYVGGVAGYCTGTIENCYVTGDINATGSVGGISGGNCGTISNCYFSGTITGGDHYVGGVVGIMDDGVIRNCYSLGIINMLPGTLSEYVGGVAGTINNGTISGCFFLNEGGLNSSLNGVGPLPLYTGVVPMSSVEMQTTSKFTDAGWDITQVGSALQTWVMIDWSVYYLCQPTFPMLSWQFADSGTSAPEDPYIITTIQQLANMQIFAENGMSLGMSWQLGKDIDLTQYLSSYGLGYNGGAGWVPIGTGPYSYSGVFDGNGHTINGLFIDSDKEYIGLIGYIQYGEIWNLGVVNASINGSKSDDYSAVGGIVGRIGGGTVDNCYYIGDVIGNGDVGGVVGIDLSNAVKNCFSIGAVTGSGNNVGGVVGEGGGRYIENCYSACTVSGNSYVGGVVGNNSNGCTVMNCYSASTVIGSNYVGGVAGINEYFASSIENCYNTGDVTITGGNSYAAGVVGFNGGPVVNCYNTGNVTGNGSITAGVVGGNDSTGKVENCFFLELTGKINSGLKGIGDIGSDDNAAPIGDEELRTQDTFPVFDTLTGKGWDFSSTGPWGIYLNDTAGGLCYGYPYIKTIDNFILITPDGGSMVSDGKPAPGPEWTADRMVDKSLFTGSLLYDPAHAVYADTYEITIGALYDPSLYSPYYQISFKDGVTFEITGAPASSGASYTITASSDSDSAITPPGQVSVQSGASETFTYSAASGYYILSVIIDGKAIDQDKITGTYTFTNVVSNHTIEVNSASGQGTSFAGMNITLTEIIVGGNGTAEYRIGSGQYVTFSGAQFIPSGSDLYVSVVPDSGYSFVEWTGDVSSKEKELKFTDVSSDIHLTAHLSSEGATGSAGTGHSGNFAFSNLILAILALLIGIVAIFAGMWSRKDEEKRASGTAVIAGILALIVGIVSIIVFFLTEDLSAPMTATDSWTVWMVVLFVVAVILAAITFWAGRDNKAKGKD